MQGRFSRFNYVTFAAMLALVAVGTVAIWSAGNARAENVFHGMWKSNLAAAGFGLAIYALLAFTDYRRTLSVLAAPAYVAAVAMLAAVLAFGSTVYGGRRWLWFFQPSEVSKICVIALLAHVLGRGGKGWTGRGFKGFLLAVAMVGVPCALILAEPDLGTVLALVPAVFAMLAAARVWRGGMLALALAVSAAAFAVLGAVHEAVKPGVDPERRERILRCVPLRDHQIRRVKAFLFPDDDISAGGYTLRQAKISIGSGGLSGKGIGKGESNHLKYLPQAISMNDFIFCVYAEETGFAGSVVLLSLFGALLLPCCWIAYVSRDARGRLLAIGVSTLLFAHVYINIAMSVGLVPITGLPLPFISSGRTFLVAVMAGLGLVQSVSIHREEKKNESVRLV